MLDQINQLTVTDLDELSQFYREVCAHQPLDDFSPDWHWGEYPSRDSLREALATHQCVVGRVGDRIAAAGILSVGEDPDYHDIPWPTQVADDEIAVLHLFAVHPDFRGQGLAQPMMRGLLTAAKAHGQRVVHLDVMTSNQPAERLYRKCGYVLAADKIMPYSDIGDTPARLYEYQL